MEVLALATSTFAALGLPPIPKPADGNHPQIIAKLAERLSVIAVSWPELAELSAATQAKLAEWKEAHAAAKARRTR